MGFVTLPELKEEAGITGNYGLYDQMVAMQWVKDNIAAFGGDPENITIMGQSAGAMSVQQHVCSPLTEGLFQKAVMSSGGGVSKMLSAQPPEKTYGFWQACMKTAGCENLAQFRALAPEKLFEAWTETRKTTKGGGMPSPCIDGRLVTMTGFDALAQGKQHKIPYMAGSNSHDLMVPILFNMAASWCKAQDTPSYTWYFGRNLPGDDHGAWHSADLWYWFGTLENCWRPMAQKDYDLSRQMVDYLCSFAATGTPQASGHPAWKAAGKEAMLFTDKPTALGKPNMAKMVATMLTNKAVGE
jgi:para-nitrobenzyl esterase